MPCLVASFDPAIGPLLGVIIAPAGSMQQLIFPKNVPSASTAPSVMMFPLLIDTGADATCISPQVAQQLNLTSIGLRPVRVPTGEDLLPRYLIDIGIPFASTPAGTLVEAPTFVLSNIEVIEFRGGSPHYQGLLGRDILMNAHFSLSCFARTFTICM